MPMAVVMPAGAGGDGAGHGLFTGGGRARAGQGRPGAAVPDGAEGRWDWRREVVGAAAKAVNVKQTHCSSIRYMYASLYPSLTNI